MEKVATKTKGTPLRQCNRLMTLQIIIHSESIYSMYPWISIELVPYPFDPTSEVMIMMMSTAMNNKRNSTDKRAVELLLLFRLTSPSFSIHISITFDVRSQNAHKFRPT